MPRHRHNSSKQQNTGKNKHQQQHHVNAERHDHDDGGNHVVVGLAAAAAAADGGVQDENRDPRLDVGVPQQIGQVLLAKCCFPLNCEIDELINVNEPEDAVKVICNNDKCDQDRWMHRSCFDDWEQTVLAYLRSCGRARSWSEKQRLQNLWTKKGYDLAYKACDCRCGRGHLRKDLDYIPPTPSQLAAAAAAKKRNKKRNDKPMPVMSNNQRHASNPQNIVPMQRDRSNSNPQQHKEAFQRVRHLSLTSTGSSPPSSASESGSRSPEGSTPPSTPCTPIGATAKKTKFDFFNETSLAVSGNIFKKRPDFSAFNILPRQKRNPYHIKMEDDGPHGNDDTRCFILSHLSTYKATSVLCTLCKHKMNVYDKYPLIDGTFFLSPVAYSSESAFAIMSDDKIQYLQAVCMHCLEGGMAVFCNQCKRRWDGSTLLLGTMYSYDIFAATPCCQRRLSCKNCSTMILGPLGGYQYYSEYSHVIQCPVCKVEDYHFVKSLSEQFFIHPIASICK